MKTFWQAFTSTWLHIYKAKMQPIQIGLRVGTFCFEKELYMY